MMADIQLRDGIEDDFKEWFSESNRILSKFPGFISRRLLQSSNNNSYRVIVEHETRNPLSKCTRAQNTKRFTPLEDPL